ncbi:MAG TPA: tetratricopeptide repeat protein, partial [Candidatus Nanoarchaeia archaeon]|nr:tetratricopeptide repeat protein [Candidatus Nanoarchaeia archaeon]
EKYKKALEIDPDYVYAHHNIAAIFWKQGRYTEGRRVWENAIKAYKRTAEKAKEDNNADNFLYFGLVQRKIFSELEEAENIFKEGLLLDPDHIGILTGLVDLYLEKEKYLIDRFLEKKEEMADERTSAHLIVLRTTNKVKRLLEDVLKKTESEKPQTLPWLGDEWTAAHWRGREEYGKAEHLLTDKLTKGEEIDTLLMLGQLLIAIEKYEDAEKYLLKAVEQDSESAQVHAQLGVVYSKKEFYKKAIRHFKASLWQEPDDLTVRSNLAEVYLKAEMHEKAETEYKKILNITPYHVESLIGMGEVCTAMAEQGERDHYGQAIHYYTDGIKIGQSEDGSKKLNKRELAAVLYSRGYARTKMYEESRDESMLHLALKDFRECKKNDPEYHKAGRAIIKIEDRLTSFSPENIREKWGPFIISGLSLLAFSLGQVGFFYYNMISVEYYILLTFGYLLFMVVGLYLPQILKLKVGSIELEKSTVDQIRTSGTLEISK